MPCAGRGRWGDHPDPHVRGSNQQPATLTVSAQLVKERPDLVDRYVAQIVNAARWSQANRVPTVQSFANEVGTSYEWAEATYGPRSHELLTPSLDVELVAAAKPTRSFCWHKALSVMTSTSNAGSSAVRCNAWGSCDGDGHRYPLHRVRGLDGVARRRPAG